MKTTWFVIADGTKASVLNYRGTGDQLDPIDGGELRHMNKPTREIASDRQGRRFQRGDQSRSAMEHPTDPQEFEKTRFAGEVVEYLQEHRDDYQQLVLVAAPKMLGYMRDNMPRELQRKVIVETDKEMTNVPVRDLSNLLQSEMKSARSLQHQ